MSDGRERTDPYAYRNGGERFNKRTFTDRIMGLEQRVRRHPRRADSLRFEIANGLRSTPYWGYAGVLWQGDLIHSVGLYYHSVEYPFNIGPIADRMERAERRFLWEYGIGELPWKLYRQLALNGRNRVIAALSALQMDAIRRYPWADIHGLEQFSDSAGRRLFARRYRDLKSRPEIAESIVACEIP
jgi:hypothetical protein